MTLGTTTIRAVDVAVFGNLNNPSQNAIDLRDTTQVLVGTSTTAFGIVANAGSGVVNLAANAGTGDLWSIGNVNFAATSAKVNGTLRCHGTSNAVAGQITGTRLENQNIILGNTVITATFPVPPPVDQTTNGTITSGPAAFGNVTLNSGGTLHLTTPGIYTFESLFLNAGTTLQIDTTASGGAFFIYIRGGTNGFSFSAATTGFDPTKVRFVCFDARGATIQAGNTTTPFLGTVVAMAGPLNMQGSARQWRGAFFGQTVTPQPNALAIHHFPFVQWEA